MDHAVLDFREMPLNCIMDFISNAVRLKKGQVPVGNNVDIDIHLSTKHTGTERIDPGYATLLHNETFHFLDGTAIGRMVDELIGSIPKNTNRGMDNHQTDDNRSQGIHDAITHTRPQNSDEGPNRRKSITAMMPSICR